MHVTHSRPMEESIWGGGITMKDTLLVYISVISNSGRGARYFKTVVEIKSADIMRV